MGRGADDQRQGDEWIASVKKKQAQANAWAHTQQRKQPLSQLENTHSSSCSESDQEDAALLPAPPPTQAGCPAAALTLLGTRLLLPLTVTMALVFFLNLICARPPGIALRHQYDAASMMTTASKPVGVLSSNIQDAGAAAAAVMAVQQMLAAEQPAGLQEEQAMWGALEAEDAWDSGKQCTAPAKGTVLPQLQHAVTLRSSRPQEEQGISIITQLSLERLPMLEQQCRRWPGPIAAVVYVPLLDGRIITADKASKGRWNGTELVEAASELASFHQKMEMQEGGCGLDLELVVEPVCSVLEAALYPLNALRNRALALARTHTLLLLDVDFVVDRNAARQLAQGEEQRKWVQEQLAQRVAVVLPAFELARNLTDGVSLEEGRELALAVADGGRDTVVNMFRTHAVVGFEVEEYAKAHTPCNYPRWTSDNSEPYFVEHAQGYEPYVIVHRSWVPVYDERFRGYGHDKILHIYHLTSMGTRFLVHPAAFVLHMPHPRSAAKYVTWHSGQHDFLKALARQVRREIKQGLFSPVVSFHHLCAP